MVLSEERAAWLQTQTVAQLRELMAARNLQGNSKLTKPEMVNLLADHYEKNMLRELEWNAEVQREKIMLADCELAERNAKNIYDVSRKARQEQSKKVAEMEKKGPPEPTLFDGSEGGKVEDYEEGENDEQS
tara:strand:+ start:24 stop:416 length:393 start_codon:yes stop_codon:yes gene_type:complete